jgi:ssDNA-binding replication factor A large subunit
VVQLPSEEEFMKILEKSGLSKKDIEEKVKQTIDRMKGLINEETALYILIKELGLDSNEHRQESSSEKDTFIKEIKEPSNNICVVGRIIDKTPVREFTKKNDGKKGLLSKFSINDGTGSINVILWDDRAKYVDQEDFKLNELVRVLNGQVKKDKEGKFEIHIGNKGDIELNPTDVDYKLYPKQELTNNSNGPSVMSKSIQISDINSTVKNVSIEGEIVLIDDPKIIDKKEKTLTLQKLMIKDSSGTITIVFWNEDIQKLKEFIENFISD